MNKNTQKGNPERKSKIVRPGTREFDELINHLDQKSKEKNTKRKFLREIIGTPSKNAIEYCRDIEKQWGSWGGFDNPAGFPIKFLAPAKGGFEIWRDGYYTPSSAFFPQLTYLTLAGRRDEAEKLEKKWGEYGGFHDNGFPKGALEPIINGLEVRNSDVYASALFSQLTYLTLTERQDEAERLEEEWEKRKGFYKNSFSKGKLSLKAGELEVDDYNVYASALFSQLTYLTLAGRRDEAEKLEEEWKNWEGINREGFPKWALGPMEYGFEVIDSQTYASSLFPHLTYLPITNRQDEAEKLEEEWKREWFYKNSFSKEGPSPESTYKNNKVYASSLFSQLTYKLISSREKE